MKKARFSVLFALLAMGMAFQSCSSDEPPEERPSNSSVNSGVNSSSSSSDGGSSSSFSIVEYAFCDFEEDRACMPGPWSVCPPGGVLSNDCHYDSSSGEGSASSGSEGGESSGSNGDTSSNSNAPSSSSPESREYEFCVYLSIQNCSPGPHTRCPGGGELSNSCPFYWEEIEEAAVYGDDLIDSRDGKTYKTIVIGTQTWSEAHKLISLSHELNVIKGAQIWMESNLNWEPTSAAGLHKCYWQGGGNGMDTYWTEEAAKVNCDKYGRLYDWVTAMALSKSCETSSCKSQITAKHKGICPNGWHIPSSAEWNALKNHIYDVLWWNYEDLDNDWDVGTKLKATSGWKEHAGYGNGVDTYGFKALAGGFCANCDNASLTSATGYYSGETIQANWWSATEFSQPDKAYSYEITFDKNTMVEKRAEKKEYLFSVRCLKD